MLTKQHKMSLSLSTILPLLLFPSLATAANVLTTGDTLPADNHLSTATSSFTIQQNCNLVLRHNGRLLFQTNTNGLASNCSLTLTDRGQLLIKTHENSTLWSSSTPGPTGLYAALIRSDGHVAVYGPSVWSTPIRAAKNLGTDREPPTARSIMISSQVLDSGSMLASGDCGLVMNDECSLELVEALTSDGTVVWDSGTKGMGRKCFLRLDHRGQLAVLDDRFKVVWASKPAEVDGFYALVVQNNGQAAVYGPAMWSTSS